MLARTYQLLNKKCGEPLLLGPMSTELSLEERLQTWLMRSQPFCGKEENLLVGHDCSTLLGPQEERNSLKFMSSTGETLWTEGLSHIFPASK